MQDTDILKLFDVISKLPPVRHQEFQQIEKFQTTCGCGKKVTLDKLEESKTDVCAKVWLDRCKGCKRFNMEKLDKETAKLFCAGCGKFLARIPPHRNIETNLWIPAGRTLHAVGCPSCPSHVKQAILGLLPDNNPDEKSALLEILAVKNKLLAIQCLQALRLPQSSKNLQGSESRSLWTP
jgi:hypothetical protein